MASLKMPKQAKSAPSSSVLTVSQTEKRPKTSVPARRDAELISVSLSKSFSDSSLIDIVDHYSFRDAAQASVLVDLFRKIANRIDSLSTQQIDNLIQANLEASISLQPGAKAQLDLQNQMLEKALSNIALLTTKEVADNAKLSNENPEQTVAVWLHRKQIFGLRVADKGMVFPAFQFEAMSGKPIASLSKVLPALLKNLAPTDLLLWFVAPNAAMKAGRGKPCEVLHDTSELIRIVRESLEPVDSW
jgi:hypothetical protein